MQLLYSYLYSNSDFVDTSSNIRHHVNYNFYTFLIFFYYYYISPKKKNAPTRTVYMAIVWDTLSQLCVHITTLFKKK